MIPVYISNDNIIIKNIDIDDLEAVLAYINESEENFKVLGRDSLMDYEEIEQRYLESLMNSLEIFCGIYYDERVIGIIKGRIENKSDNELWILSYLLAYNFRRSGNGTRVLKLFEEYFVNNYSINKFCILIMEDNEEGQNFWYKNNYQIVRVIKTSRINNNSDMMILEKKSLK